MLGYWIQKFVALARHDIYGLFTLLLFPEKHQSLDKHIMVSPCPVYLSQARKKPGGRNQFSLHPSLQ